MATVGPHCRLRWLIIGHGVFPAISNSVDRLQKPGDSEGRSVLQEKSWIRHTKPGHRDRPGRTLWSDAVTRERSGITRHALPPWLEKGRTQRRGRLPGFRSRQ